MVDRQEKVRKQMFVGPWPVKFRIQSHSANQWWGCFMFLASIACFAPIIGQMTGLQYFFPTCQVRVVRFYVSCPAPSSPSPSPRRTSSASSWSQWSSPDLICQFCLAVVVAGPHLRALDRSGRPRTTSASSWSQWAFNRRESAHCGPRRKTTGEIRRAVSLAGLQPARFGAPWASPDFNQTSTARNKAI